MADKKKPDVKEKPDVKYQMVKDGSLRKESGQFVGIKELSTALKEANRETNKEAREANAKSAQELQAQDQNTKQLVANGVQAGILAKQKEKSDALLKAKIDKQVAIESGEYGFRGLFNNGKESIRTALMMDKSFAEGFAEIGEAFKNDIQFVGQMLSPLTAIPGVSTALTALQFVGGKILTLATVDGRRKAKEWIAQKKQWAWEKLQAAKAKLSGRAQQFQKDGFKGTAKKGGNALLKLFTKLFRGVATVILGIIVFVFSFFKSIGSQIGKLLSGPWNAIKNVFLKYKPKWANAKSISKVFTGPWDKIKNLFGKIKIPAGVTNAFNMVKGFFGSAKGGIGGAFKKIKTFLDPVTKAVQKLMQSPAVRFMGKLGSALGKFFLPITIIMGVWQSVKGLIDGWKQTEGTFFDRVIGGLAGIVESLVNFFIMMPMDLIKDMLAWIGEKLGLIGPDTKKAINDFSFQELFSTMWQGLVNIGLALKNWVAAVLAGAWAGIKAAWPGGESPMGAFKRVYNARIASGGGSYKGGGLGGDKATGDMIENMSEENKREKDKKESDRAGGGSGDSNTQIINQKTDVRNDKKIVVDTSGPIDPVAAYASAQN